MTSDEFDLDMTTWLDSVAPPRAPDDLLPAALGRTARVRQRPGWLVSERWTTMQSTVSRHAFHNAPSPSLIVALIALALLSALLIGGVGRGPAAPRLAIAFSVGSGSTGYIDGMTATGTDVTQLVARSRRCFRRLDDGWRTPAVREHARRGPRRDLRHAIPTAHTRRGSRSRRTPPRPPPCLRTAAASRMPWIPPTAAASSSSS